ncbi:MAG: glycoside hydrolase family 5 protein [Polyangiales bacterium]
MARRSALLLICMLGCTDNAPSEPDPMEPTTGKLDAGRRDAGVEARDARTSVRDAKVEPDDDPEPQEGRDASSADATAEEDASIDPPRDAARPPGNGTDDDIYGTRVPRAESWWVEDGRIHRGRDEIRLYGLNWFGLETESLALFGPSESKRSVADFLAQVKSLGFNALRVPLSPESIRPGNASASWANRGDLDTGREHFDELAKAAKDAGLYMLWDVHTCAAKVGFMKKSPIDPACTNYGKQGWLADLDTLAKHAEQYAPYVLGIDLFNEPYGLTWGDWKALAEEGGERVLRANPHLLLFVEGVGSEGYSGDAVFWGENLTEAKNQPPRLPASRLVYSPHVYGPSVFAQPYFSEAGYPGNMPAIWTRHWGHLFEGEAPVILGEFGGKYVDADKVWQDALVKYLNERGANGFFYWCLNPNSGDTAGLLQDDWKTVNQGKLSLLKMLMK